MDACALGRARLSASLRSWLQAPESPSERTRDDPKASSWGSEAEASERPVSRVLFRRRVALAPAKIIPLDRPLLDGSSTLTRTPRLGRNLSDRADRSRRCAYSSLLREGLASPPVARLSRVGSYPTISPLPVKKLPRPPRTCNSKFRNPKGSPHRRCLFCGAFPRVTPGRR